MFVFIFLQPPASASDTTNETEEKVTVTRNENRKKRKHNLPVISETIEENQYIDEFDKFGKNIASELRQMPIYNALQCQEKIKSAINEERLLVKSRQQEIESLIIKEEPGLSEQLCDENTQTNNRNKKLSLSPSYIIKTENISDTDSITDDVN